MNYIRNITLIGMLLIPASSRAETQDNERLNAFFNLAAASSLELKCPLWQINKLMLGIMLTKVRVVPADIQNRGKYFKDYVTVAVMVNSLNEKQKLTNTGACKVAETMFGPHGDVVPNFMLTAQ
jgi:hypothetical protein